MSKSLPETPNTPAELFALNEEPKFDVEDPNALVKLIDELHDEYEPNPLQGLRAAQDLIDKLYHYHFHMVENAEENDFTPFQLQMWKDDTALLKQVVMLLRQINT